MKKAIPPFRFTLSFFRLFLICAGMILFLPALSFQASGQDSSLDGLFEGVEDYEISQETDYIDSGDSGEEDTEGSFPESDDLDSFFDAAEDVPAEAVSSAVASEEKEKTFSSGGLNSLLSQSSPLSFSGHLEAEVGIGYIWSERENTLSGYFDFENDLKFSARTSKYLSITGNIKTEFPAFTFDLSELYFDYLLFDRVYISGGKRLFRWGYIRLFDDDEEYDDSSGRYQPNILYDSDRGISARIIVPVGFATFTAVGLYSGKNETPSKDAMAYAGSIELKLGRTSLNFFGRSFPTVDSETNLPLADPNPPILGLEAKRSFFGVDLYAQGQGWIESFYRLGDLDKTGFDTIVFTCGIMKFWDTIKPNIFVNLEYQNAYIPLDDSFNQKLAFLGAVSKFGPGDHLTVGVEWHHNITERCGDVTPGIIVSGVLPHARWKNAVEIYYGQDENGNIISRPQVKLGTTIYLVMDY